MDMKNLEQHSRDTRNQAKSLLQSTGLLDILKKYGGVHLIGSYPLNIMHGPDIDIVVESKAIRRNSVNVLQEIVKNSYVRGLNMATLLIFKWKIVQKDIY